MSQASPPIDTTLEEQQQPHPHPVKKKQYQQQGGYRDEKQNYHQQRPQYRRQNRPVYVEDLREKLNRKRREKDEEQGTSTSGPPPDPNYNFLKDPARDGDPPAPPQERRHQYNQQRRPNEPRNRYHSNRPQKPTTIQPVNIKVELSTSTGQRSCVVDEEHKLPEIKHVPDRYDGGRRAYGTRYYSSGRNQQQQQQRPPPERRPYQQNRRGFKGEQRKREDQEVAVLQEENWDAEVEDDSKNKGSSVAEGGLENSNQEDEGAQQKAVVSDEEPEEGTDETDFNNEGQIEGNDDGNTENCQKESVQQSAENKPVELEEAGTRDQKPVEEKKTTQIEETELKESIIIEPSKK